MNILEVTDTFLGNINAKNWYKEKLNKMRKIKNDKMNLYAKQKQTHRHRKCSYGYQRRSGGGIN